MIEDPPIARFLFEDARMGWVWLIARLYVGYAWITSGWGKIDNPAWMDTGAALQGFWQNAVQQPETARPTIAFDWYRSFIEALLNAQAYTWFAPLIVFSEIIVGALLILGAFTGIAAFLGGFLNWNFMMAGTASINPLLFTLSILLILAWKNAGWIGLDRWLLPVLGTPWQPGLAFRRGEGLPEEKPSDRDRAA
jgi:thiosulfate dehydrogenase (quinone) large subunit